MKKKILCIVLAFSSYAYAQVGINTEKPKATLDISANLDGAVTVPSGLLIPRVTRTQAASVTTDTSLVTTPVESTLIYVSEVDGIALTSGVARDINTTGFYYYSISEPPKWIKIMNNPDGTSNFSFNNGLTPTNSGNITNVQLGGNLETPTTIGTSVGKNLAISGNINNAFSVDDETFSVDGATNNVGIGTTTPQSKLHVLGSVQFTKSLKVGDAASEGALGQYLVSGGPGESPKWVNGPSDGVNPSPIAVSARNGLSIVPDDNTEFVELGGSINRETNLVISNHEGGSIPSFNISGGGINAFSVGGKNLSVDNENDFVGIGTIAPSTKLHIYNNTSGAIRIVDGTQAADRVLTSDEDGVATWKDDTTFTNAIYKNENNIVTLGGDLIQNTSIKGGNGINNNYKLSIDNSVANGFSAGETAFSVDTYLKRVGIGITNPRAKLHIDNDNPNLSTIIIKDGTEGENKVLTSNDSGVGTWKDIPQNTTALNGLTPSTANGITTIKLGGNLTEDTRIDTYPPGGIRYNLQLVGLEDSAATDTGILMVDAYNNVRKTTNLSNNLRIPEPAIFELNGDIDGFLGTIGEGDLQEIPMKTIVNAIDEISISETQNSTNINFEPGIYQFTFVYEGVYVNASPSCTISSYFVDFPIVYRESLKDDTQRIHSTASHITGQHSNHGGTISFTTILTENSRSWEIKLGKGQSGNCENQTDLQLKGGSTQLTILRMGDVPN